MHFILILYRDIKNEITTYYYQYLMKTTTQLPNVEYTVQVSKRVQRGQIKCGWKEFLISREEFCFLFLLNKLTTSPSTSG